MNFFSLHRTARTEVWLSATFGLWAIAATLHLIDNYGKENGTLSEIIQILFASLSAAGFGWRLRNLVILTRTEKRGKSTSDQEFGAL